MRSKVKIRVQVSFRSHTLENSDSDAAVTHVRLVHRKSTTRLINCVASSTQAALRSRVR